MCTKIRDESYLPMVPIFHGQFWESFIKGLRV